MAPLMRMVSDVDCMKQRVGHLIGTAAALGLVAVMAPAMGAQGSSDISALCGDGTKSKARTVQAACSRQGGVAIWYGGRAKTRAEGRAVRNSTVPARATAECNDGTFFFGKPRVALWASRSGACLAHDGVRAWFK